MPPKFFVTHSWKDIEFAHRLCDDLHANGLEGFFDAHSMTPGDSIPSRIERGLIECDVYIPVFSPDALKSDWCDWEIDIAITMNRTQKGQPRIIPVIAQPCTVPRRLMHLLYINFVGRYDEALDELLTKGFGLPRPSQPIPEQPTVPASHPSTGKSFSTRLVAWLVTIFVFGIVLAAILSRLGSGAQPTPLAQATATVAPLPAVAALPTAATSRAPSTLPTPTSMPSPSSAPHLGSTKTAKDGSLMLYVPAGEFLMGSNDADQQAFDVEKPQHAVYLDAYWISKFEVTNALYKKCVDAGRCSVPANWVNSAIPAGKENHPVADVTWSYAVAYAKWIGARLPTEAEWEKAACWDEANKAKRAYPWGNEYDQQNVNMFGSDTTTVGKYSPRGDSPYGVSDMVGNVFEWVADWYDENYYGNSPKQNPQGPSSGTKRALRGGSWFIADDRCASRNGFEPGEVFSNFGFRIAESVSP